MVGLIPVKDDYVVLAEIHRKTLSRLWKIHPNLDKVIHCLYFSV